MDSPDNARYYGKYRGVVTENRDPLNLGRVRAKVPAVLGDVESVWCMPCVPVVHADSRRLAIPQSGDNVWIEFEAGDPSYPIWVGTWWSEGNAPEPGTQP